MANWFKVQRVNWIVEMIQIYDFINRYHVERKFGVSTPQASADLKDAMRGRDLINVAKGVVMARETTDEQSALMVLAALANERHRPLREVASEVAGSTVRPGR